MNNAILNALVKVTDLGYDMDIMYKRTKWLKRAVGRHGKLLFISTIAFGTLLYRHETKMKKMNQRIASLEYQLANAEEAWEEDTENTEE